MMRACALLLKIEKVVEEGSPFKAALGAALDGVCKPVVGIDMSISMHAAVRSNRSAEEFHQDPPYPAQHVAVAILTLIRKINKAGFRALPVFDRISRHPLKAAGAGVVRNRSSSNAAESRTRG